jgi:uncharacterized protein (AIM24 family)
MNAFESHPETVQTLAGFVSETGEQGLAAEPFANETARTLRIDVDGGVWLKPGAAVAYRGEIRFERLPTLGAASAKNALLREAAPLVRASGAGRLYCGRHGAHVRTVRLTGECIVVSWHALVAFEDSLSFETALVSHGVSLAAGGLVVVTLAGHGSFALATHGRPLTLQVTPGGPVSTDPHATLAWSAALTPTLKTDLSWRSAFGHGGQEPFQMFFDGTGFVVVQPYEDASRFGPGPHPIRKVISLVAG